MKNLTWQNPEQLFVAQELINKVKSKCCGIKGLIKALNEQGLYRDGLDSNEIRQILTTACDKVRR